MKRTFLEKHGLILLTTVMIVVMVIVATMLLYGGTTPPPRATLDIQSTGSSDSPQSTRYLLVVAIHPPSTKISWKDVVVIARPDCVSFEGNPDDCPGSEVAVQGTHYTVQDKDGNDRVSKDDVLVYNISAGSHWGKVIMLQWKKTSNIMYEETLPLS